MSDPNGWLPITPEFMDGRWVLLWLGAPWLEVEKARYYKPWGTWIIGEFPDDPEEEEIYGIGSTIPTCCQPLPEPPS